MRELLDVGEYVWALTWQGAFSAGAASFRLNLGMDCQLRATQTTRLGRGASHGGRVVD
jgi:hypothetical protein